MAKVKVWVQRMNDRPNLVLQWTDPLTGKRKSKSAETADPKEAADKAKDLEYELRHGKYAEPSKVAWSEFRKIYRADVLPGLRPRSREKVETVFTVFEAITTPTKMAVIDARSITRFVSGMRARILPKGKVGLAPITQHNYLTALKTALEWAVTQGFLAEVPPFPEIHVPKKKPQPIPAEAFERLLEAAPDDQWRAFLLCGWYAGLRLSEANQLRRSPSDEWPWLDLDADRIILPAAFVKAAEDQWVPLHATLRDAILELPEQSDRVFELRSRATRNQGQLLTRSGISTIVGDFARAAGVRLSMHKLRKGFGCRVASKLGKGNAPILHRLMRHSSMQVTMDYYSSVDDVLHKAMGELV